MNKYKRDTFNICVVNMLGVRPLRVLSVYTISADMDEMKIFLQRLYFFAN